MIAKRWPGAAIVAGALVLQLAGIGILLASRGSLGVSGEALSIVLGATLGLGLVSMQERMSLVDGAIAIDSRLGAGTRVRAQVPLGVSRRLAVGGV